MQKIRYSFLFIIGLTLIFGTASAAFSQKRDKNLGYLFVKSSPNSYPVLINGDDVGMSGTVGRGNEFALEPDDYLVEIEGPNGEVFKKNITIRKRETNCICLTVREKIETRPCPYNVVVDGPDRFLEGDTITFNARNIGIDTSVPVNYKWTVTGGTISSGQNTNSITVETRGMGGQTVRAYLDVTDDIPGSKCFQKNEAVSYPEEKPKIEKIQCDVFESKSRDDDKARFDNCVLKYNAMPNSQIYVILYQGTGRGSIGVDRLAKQTLDYFVRNRGISPGAIVMTRGGNRERTTVEVWIVPPGAQPPVPQ